MEKVKIGGKEYPATISGLMSDAVWDGRASKAITVEMQYGEAAQLFVDRAQWSIISEWEEDVLVINPDTGEPILDADGNEQFEIALHRDEFDNSDYNVAGPITDNRNGTVTVKMGKLTDLEEAYEMLFGGKAE